MKNTEKLNPYLFNQREKIKEIKRLISLKYGLMYSENDALDKVISELSDYRKKQIDQKT